MTAFISAWSKDIVTGCNGAGGGDGGGWENREGVTFSPRIYMGIVNA